MGPEKAATYLATQVAREAAASAKVDAIWGASTKNASRFNN